MDEIQKIRAAENEIDKLLQELEIDLGREIDSLDFDNRQFTARRISIYVEPVD